MSEYKNEIVLTFNNEILSEYSKLYLKANPRARKVPISDPIPPSLNKFIIQRRPAQNTIKQKWKEFGMYVARKYKNLNLDDVEIEIQFTFKDRRRRDLDNYIATSLKLIQDALSAEEGIGVIKDDSYSVVKKISATAKYEKGVQELVLIIRHNKEV